MSVTRPARVGGLVVISYRCHLLGMLVSAGNLLKLTADRFGLLKAERS